jgi:hypothetical protein
VLQLPRKKSSGRPWKKLLFTLTAVAFIVVALLFWQNRAARKRELAAVIQSSTVFAAPVTVEASSSGGIVDIPNLEAITLRNAGLLAIDYEPVSTPPSGSESSTEPNSMIVETMRQTTKAHILNQPALRLIPESLATTRDWQSFEDREHQRRGWIVPVGTRELLELTSIQEAGADTAQVQFTWLWKPNEVGRYFDINAQPQKSDRTSRHWSNPRLSSEYPFKGTADLNRSGNRWEVKAIRWDLEMTVKSIE